MNPETICIDLARPNGAIEQVCHHINGKGIIVRETSSPPRKARILDLRGTGLIALPGLIDMHVHLRGLRLSYKETVRTGTMAALRGGLTLVADMPNTRPPLNTPETIQARIEEIREQSMIDVKIIAGIPPREGLAHKIARNPSVVAFKVYPKDLEKPGLIKEAASTGLPIILHPELPQADRETQPETPETRTVLRPCHTEAAAIPILREIIGPDTRLHVTHASCPTTVMEAKKAEATVDVTPHHLIYDTNHTPNKNSCYAKVNPPLRTALDRQALLQLLITDKIDAIASDHAPHTRNEKNEPLTCASGIPWLELWPWAVMALLRGLGVTRALQILAEKASRSPAAILGLPERAVEGGEATYTVIRLESGRFTGFQYSKAPPDYHFMLETYGQPEIVIIRGKLQGEQQ